MSRHQRRLCRLGLWPLLPLLAVCLTGCLKLGNEPEPLPAPAPPPPPPKPAAPLKSEAFATFEKLRADLLKGIPQIGQGNCVFALGIDVSESAYSSQVLEYTTKLLSDACRYFFVPGDKIILVPWDKAIREDHVTAFDYSDGDKAVADLNASFENLENLVEPETQGSNLLDARGYCLQKALSVQGESAGTLCPVVIIFTDIRVPDIDPKRQKYSAQRLTDLRKKMGGGQAAEFDVKAYQAGERTQIIVHALAGKGQAAPRGVDRNRSPQERAAAAPTTVEEPPRPRDTGGMRALLIVLALVSLLALIGLPFAWQHQVSIGDAKERVRAFGGRIVVQSGRGISPRGVVFLPVPGLDDQPLLAIEGKGPQLVATARRGVRLNDGRTELAIPLGRPVTLRIAIDGVPGEQALSVQVGDFFATNTGPIIGMIVAFLVIVGCIIG